MQDADSARCLSAVTTASLFARGRALQSAKLGNLESVVPLQDPTPSHQLRASSRPRPHSYHQLRAPSLQPSPSSWLPTTSS
jgi:hypothetical protein